MDNSGRTQVFILWYRHLHCTVGGQAKRSLMTAIIQ